MLKNKDKNTFWLFVFYLIITTSNNCLPSPFRRHTQLTSVNYGSSPLKLGQRDYAFDSDKKLEEMLVELLKANDKANRRNKGKKPIAKPELFDNENILVCRMSKK